MWTIIKINSKRILELKKDFYKKLGNEVRFYQPKFKIEKIKNNKIINYEKNLFGDYLFCYHEKFKNSGFCKSFSCTVPTIHTLQWGYNFCLFVCLFVCFCLCVLHWYN